ncbi:uncharacterized protein A4U43_C04F32860 [Asparagus officinalis]|uniref:Reverse transcriptase Ty1/copia-type domain-containing protein n=1 Tax=Asparagus officinalis TaxID=4686 RepID=A0A5P1F834_ASPOF|nr:uncharacterized protein A4U43_C04F32860 [Asparagus officinalis]
MSRFASHPEKQHWEVVKWILRYLRETMNMPLCFERKKLVLQGYVDADFAGDHDTRQKYVAVTEASKEMIMLTGCLEELDLKRRNGVLYGDS